MGILGFLKKEKTAIKDVKNVAMNEIENYLSNYAATAGLDTKIAMLQRDLSSKVIKLNELLNELENVKLKEEKVLPERIKSIFEGNRTAFIDKIRAFIPELKIPEDKEQIDVFLISASDKINALSIDTQKNYFVLKEFVEDNVRPILSKIKDIDTVISSSRGEFEKTNLSKLKEIRTLCRKFEYLTKEVEGLSKELEHTVQMKQAEFERKSKFDQKLEQLKETKAYDEYKSLQEREKNLIHSITQAERQIKEIFMKIESGIKKRANATQSLLLDKYSSNPLVALAEDETLEILNEINYIKNNAKELALKKEKRDALLKNIEEIGVDKLMLLRKDYLTFKEELELVIIRLKDNHYERSLKEREGWIESVNKNIEAIERKQQDIENLMERIDPRYVKQKIRDLLRMIDSTIELK